MEVLPERTEKHTGPCMVGLLCNSFANCGVIWLYEYLCGLEVMRGDASCGSSTWLYCTQAQTKAHTLYAQNQHTHWEQAVKYKQKDMNKDTQTHTALSHKKKKKKKHAQNEHVIWSQCFLRTRSSFLGKQLKTLWPVRWSLLTSISPSCLSLMDW